jgi:hypothetical protein
LLKVKHTIAETCHAQRQQVLHTRLPSSKKQTSKQLCWSASQCFCQEQIQ